MNFGLTASELSLFKKLSSPIKIQDFLDTIPLNFEKHGETYMSPRRALKENKMHCMEGALFAATALWLHGEKPLLLDLKTDGGDDDHVVALFKQNGYFGAISKTNHSSLRFRDPIYKTLRELALSYFHEYFINPSGKKVLRSFSRIPFDLSTFGTDWITAEEDLQHLVDSIDARAHTHIIPAQNKRLIRRADAMELRAGELREWHKKDPRT